MTSWAAEVVRIYKYNLYKKYNIKIVLFQLRSVMTRKIRENKFTPHLCDEYDCCLLLNILEIIHKNKCEESFANTVQMQQKRSLCLLVMTLWKCKYKTCWSVCYLFFIFTQLDHSVNTHLFVFSCFSYPDDKMQNWWFSWQGPIKTCW